MKKSMRKDIIIVVVALLLAAASLSLIGKLKIDSSTDAFMPKKDKVVLINEEIERQFGSLDAIIVGMLNPEGSVLEPQALAILDNLSHSISTLPFVHKVISLTNTDHMQSGPDGFEVVPLFTGTSPSAIALLKERLSSWSEVYDGDLISADRHMAALVVQPEAGTSQTNLNELTDEISSLVAQLPPNGLQFSLVGLPLVKQQINRSLLGDVAILAPIVGFLLLLVLLFSFRRLGGVIIPLIGLLISASITLGIMALFNITVTMATLLVPVLLLIVGSAYAIHVMSHFYEELIFWGDHIDVEKTHSILAMVVKRNRMPIIMAGATTAAGFIAQFTSPLGPFRTFGLLSAIGVVLSQLSSLYLLPALLRLTYRSGIDTGKLKTQREIKRTSKSQPVFDFFERVATKRGKLLGALSIILVVVTIVCIPFIKTGTDMLKFFHRSTPLVKNTETFNHHMSGSRILTIMIDSKEDSGVLDPSFLQTVESFAADITAIQGVGKVQSIIPYLKRMNFIMNQDNEPYRQHVEQAPDFDFFGDDFGVFSQQTSEIIATSQIHDWDPQTYLEIPFEPEKYALQTTADLKSLMSQYLLLYAGNLGLLINDDIEPSATLITIQMHENGDAFLRKVSNTITQFWDSHLPSGWSYAVGGGEAVTLALSDLVTKSQIYSLVGALLIVWLLVSFIFRSFKAGLLGLIPVVFALMGIFIAMVAFNIGLDVITSLLAALAIGIGVDYAIHFIAACQRIGLKTIQSTGLSAIMRTTGRAIIINAASVTIGFAGLIFSRFIPIRQMGILFCVSMVFAALSSLTVLPMVILRLKPTFLSAPTEPPAAEENNNSLQRSILP